jgi:hypothetical protein
VASSKKNKRQKSSASNTIGSPRKRRDLRPAAKILAAKKKKAVSDLTDKEYLQHVEDQNKLKELRQELTRLKSAYSDASNLKKSLENLVAQLPKPLPIEVPARKSKAKADRQPVSMVIGLNDWHCGLSFESEEVQEYGEYSWKIAQKRLETLVNKLTKWTRQMSDVYRVEEVVVLGLGDFCDGTIHLENVMFNEFGPMEQAINSGYALARVLHGLRPLAPVLRYEGLNTDNHGRLTKKPIYTGRGLWNLNQITHEIAKLSLGKAGVDFRTHNGIKADVDVQGKTFLIEHGDELRGWMGIPYYGIQRLKHREADRRSRAKKKPFDYLVTGHWHTFYLEENAMISPSLCGTTPYDHGAARYSTPVRCASSFIQRMGGSAT